MRNTRVNVRSKNIQVKKRQKEEIKSVKKEVTKTDVTGRTLLQEKTGFMRKLLSCDM
jgi:hypothetical protein